MPVLSRIQITRRQTIDNIASVISSDETVSPTLFRDLLNRIKDVWPDGPSEFRFYGADNFTYSVDSFDRWLAGSVVPGEMVRREVLTKLRAQLIRATYNK